MFSAIKVLFITIGLSTAVNITNDWALNLIEEGPCIDPNPETAVFKLEGLRTALTSDWYITMGSRLYIYTLTTLLFGEPKTNTEFLNKLCLKFPPGAPMTTIVGYSKETTDVACRSDKVGLQECRVWNKTNTAAESGVKSVATWTDNNKYIFMTLCLSNAKKAWVILGNEKPGDMTDAEKSTIQTHIISLGFNPDLAQNFSYDLCEVTKAAITTSSPIIIHD